LTAEIQIQPSIERLTLNTNGIACSAHWQCPFFTFWRQEGGGPEGKDPDFLENEVVQPDKN
jgi:hypothetical protein